MKNTIKDLPKSQKEISVEISVEEMEKYLNNALDKLAKNIKLDGFRDGKVPKNVAKKQLGDDAISGEANQLAIEDSYFKIIKENKLNPLGQPKVEITKSALGNPLEYKIVISVMPEIKLGNYKTVFGKMEVKKIDDEMIEKEIRTLQKKKASYLTKNEAAEKDDRVEIDFETRVAGVKLEGGESKNHPLVIGQGKFVPGFEDRIIGMKKDEEKEFDLVFPENYKKDLAGKKASFKVKINLVQKVDLPEVNDEFAKGLGKFESLEDLKKNMRKGMTIEEEGKAKEKLRGKLIDQVAEKITVEIPEILIESELNNMINEFKNNITQTGIEFEEYLKNVNTNLEKLKNEWQPMAEKRTKTGLVMREISLQEEIKISDEEIEQKVNETLKFYPNEKELRKNMDLEKFKDHMAGVIMNEKVFGILEGIAESNKA
ncbi:MAG: trigger factor [Candidatus Pacebacteria bacterium]|nr:trigger factor [Candidatus Paceibacterota bacterium]